MLTVQTVFLVLAAFAQPAGSTVSKYGVTLINDPSTFRATAMADSNKAMVELKQLIPAIRYDLRYVGTNNFMGRSMYPAGTNLTFLRRPAARALALVQAELSASGLGLKIYDAYRPYSVTEKFWELIGDERYVADPKKGSGHNRGLAVDLTIIDLKSGKELRMPTGFDNFSDTAHHAFMQLPEEVLEHRALLRKTMETYGFRSFDTEWWHYFWPNDRNYEVLDLSFKQLNKLRK